MHQTTTMNSSVASLLVIVLIANVLVAVIAAVPPYGYFDGYPAEEYGEGALSSDGTIGGEKSSGNDMAALENRLLQGLNKRSCIRRGSRCDHRPDDCCSGGACRCNLLGSNCQCQRMGFFQKWGR